MRYVFYNKTEQEKELITNVLDRWCVPWNKETHEQNSIFGTRLSYDIIIDVKPEKIEWVKEKVQERFDLENTFEGPCAERPQIENKKQETRTLFEDLFTPNFGIDIPELKKEQNNTKSLIQEIEEMFDTHIKPRSKDLNSPEKLGDYMDRMGLKDKLRDIYNRNCHDFNDAVRQELTKFFIDKKNELLSESLEDITKDALEITYNELPQPLRDDLESQYPKSLLMSNKCRFYRTKNGIALIIDQT